MRKQTKLYNNKEANFKALSKCVYLNFVFYLKRPSFKGTVGITRSNEKNSKTINAKIARYFFSICPYYLLNGVKWRRGMDKRTCNFQAIYLPDNCTEKNHW